MIDMNDRVGPTPFKGVFEVRDLQGPTISDLADKGMLCPAVRLSECPVNGHRFRGPCSVRGNRRAFLPLLTLSLSSSQIQGPVCRARGGNASRDSLRSMEATDMSRSSLCLMISLATVVEICSRLFTMSLLDMEGIPCACRIEFLRSGFWCRTRVISYRVSLRK